MDGSVPAPQDFWCNAGSSKVSPGFGNSTWFYLPAIGQVVDRKLLGGPVRLYADGGVSQLSITCSRTLPTGTFNFNVMVVGYTVDMNVPIGQ